MIRRGIRNVTDEKIIEEFKAGKFIGQIKRDHHVGVNRIRAVLDRQGLRDREVAAA